MSRELDPDVAASVQSRLQHLNRKHPGTVLFLARHAAGASDAVDAELLAVDRDGVDIEVRAALGSTTTRLEFTAPINAASDLRHQLQGLLAEARVAAPDDPLTSLEEEIASHRD
jgi:putative heme iron utilization protein